VGTRVVRDGLLESEPVLSLPPEGRWLYVSVLLSADDYGLFEATPFKLAKRADVKREHVPVLLQAMADVDLVRLYQPDALAARSFGIVTKFGQRMRAARSKFPLPPFALVADQGPEYLYEFNKLVRHMTGTCPPLADTRRPEAEAETEIKRNTNTVASLRVATAAAAATRTAAVACPTDELVALWHGHCAPPLARVDTLNDARRAPLSARWREVCAASAFDGTAGLDWFRWFFAERVASSAFLMGRTEQRGGKRWRCSWDWLMRPTNFAKVVDGNYVDRKE
jgi:hypothetical protein